MNSPVSFAADIELFDGLSIPGCERIISSKSVSAFWSAVCSLFMVAPFDRTVEWNLHSIGMWATPVAHSLAPVLAAFFSEITHG